MSYPLKHIFDLMDKQVKQMEKVCAKLGERVECIECGGEGTVIETCCGREPNDWGICPECKEHSEGEECTCPDCDGDGWVLRHHLPEVLQKSAKPYKPCAS